VSHKGEDKSLREYIKSVYEKVRNKTVFADQLRTHTSVIAWNSFDSAWHEGFEYAIEKFVPGTDIWAVAFYTGFGSFKLHTLDPAALRAWVEEQERLIIPKKDPPAKVVAKMIALRIKRACESAQYLQDSNNSRRTYIMGEIDTFKKGLKKNPAWQQQINEYEKQLADLQKHSYLLNPESTPEQLREWAADMRKRFSSYDNFKDLLAFMDRPDVTEEMIRMALDMMLVKEIHQS
jgi:hypothetical protein